MVKNNKTQETEEKTTQEDEFYMNSIVNNQYLLPVIKMESEGGFKINKVGCTVLWQGEDLDCFISFGAVLSRVCDFTGGESAFIRLKFFNANNEVINDETVRITLCENMPKTLNYGYDYYFESESKPTYYEVKIEYDTNKGYKTNSKVRNSNDLYEIAISDQGESGGFLFTGNIDPGNIFSIIDFGSQEIEEIMIVFLSEDNEALGGCCFEEEIKVNEFLSIEFAAVLDVFPANASKVVCTFYY